MKSSFTPFWQDQASIALPTNSLPLSEVMDSGAPLTSNDSAQLLGYFLARLGTFRVNAKALPCVLIDDCEDSEPATIRKPIAHKIHTPSLIRPACSGQRYAHLPCSFRPLR